MSASISSRSPVALGVDIGGAWVKTVVVTSEGQVHRQRVRRTESVADTVADRVTDGIEQFGVECAGIGIAGLVESTERKFVWGPHLSETEVDVGDIADRYLDGAIVDNDSNLAAFGEWADGAAKGHRVALTVSIGTGIGAGLIVDGDIWRGSNFAGEVGHMQVVESGDVCPCGNRGCWETLVSGRQLGLAAETLGLEPTTEALVAAARVGSEEARQVLRRAAEWLAVGISNLVLVQDPSVVVVAGGVSEVGDLLLDASRNRIASALPGVHRRRRVVVRSATHGRWSAAMGAAIRARVCLLGDTTEPNETSDT